MLPLCMGVQLDRKSLKMGLLSQAYSLSYGVSKVKAYLGKSVKSNSKSEAD